MVALLLSCSAPASTCRQITVQRVGKALCTSWLTCRYWMAMGPPASPQSETASEARHASDVGDTSAGIRSCQQGWQCGGRRPVAPPTSEALAVPRLTSITSGADGSSAVPSAS